MWQGVPVQQQPATCGQAVLWPSLWREGAAAEARGPEAALGLAVHAAADALVVVAVELDKAAAPAHAARELGALDRRANKLVPGRERGALARGGAEQPQPALGYLWT